MILALGASFYAICNCVNTLSDALYVFKIYFNQNYHIVFLFKILSQYNSLYLVSNVLRIQLYTLVCNNMMLYGFI